MADSGFNITGSSTMNSLYSINVPASYSIDIASSNTFFWGCGIPASFVDNSASTNYTLCQFSGVGLKSKWRKGLDAVFEQMAGDTFRIWRSDFVKVELMRDAAGQNGYIIQDSSTNLVIFDVASGVPTEILKYDKSTGAWVINNMPTSSAGLTTGALWNNSGVVNIV